MIIVSLSLLEATARARPPGYLEEALKRGRIVGEMIHFTAADYNYLAERFSGPSLLDLAENFNNAVTSWVAAGFPVVKATEYDRRLGICRKCVPYWSEDARMGLGRCGHQACGCTRLKHWLGTEKCPVGKW